MIYTRLNEFDNLINHLRLQAIMTVKPLSPLYIWVHIIEKEIWFYRKRDNLRWWPSYLQQSIKLRS